MTLLPSPKNNQRPASQRLMQEGTVGHGFSRGKNKPTKRQASAAEDDALRTFHHHPWSPCGSPRLQSGEGGLQSTEKSKPAQSIISRAKHERSVKPPTSVGGRWASAHRKNNSARSAFLTAVGSRGVQRTQRHASTCNQSQSRPTGEPSEAYRRARSTLLLFIALLGAACNTHAQNPQAIQAGDAGPLLKVSDPPPITTQKQFLRDQAHNHKNGDDITKELPPYLERGLPAHDFVTRDMVLPTDESGLIIEGKVTNAVARLSNDKHTLYSTFSIDIEKVLLNKKAYELRAGDTIDVERSGGRLLHTSGKIEQFGYQDEHMPIIGDRYIFFLIQTPGKFKWTITNGEGWYLRLAYLMHNDKVYSLDGEGTDPKRNGYLRFNGKPLSEFMTALEAKISQLSPAHRQ